jgi:large subunit ribosomal protein L13
MFKTYINNTPKTPQSAEEYVIDAAGQTLGRIATDAASHLLGKHRTDFSYNQDQSDRVIVVNFAQIKVTGKKGSDKKYYHHSDYMGGIKEISFDELMEKKPVEAFRLAVKGMLPRTRLGIKLLKHLTVFSGARE